jgi:hypothetical protein
MASEFKGASSEAGKLIARKASLLCPGTPRSRGIFLVPRSHHLQAKRKSCRAHVAPRQRRRRRRSGRPTEEGTRVIEDSRRLRVVSSR